MRRVRRLDALAWTPLAAMFVYAILVGQPCLAGTIDKTGAPQLTLTVGGDIQSKCGLGHAGDIALGDLTQAVLSADTDIGVHCNVPFDLTVKSMHGGLRNIAHPDGSGPYAGVRGYALTVSVPVETPDSLSITDTYTADQLVGGQTISSEGGIASQNAHLHLMLDAITAPGLAAGDYSETIELSITALL
jgi:hypothetical protein